MALHDWVEEIIYLDLPKLLKLQSTFYESREEAITYMDERILEESEKLI
jgi:hypothetical protein